MGATSSKSDHLYKKISKRTRRSPVKSINIKQSDEDVKDEGRRRRRAARQARVDQKPPPLVTSSNEDVIPSDSSTSEAVPIPAATSESSDRPTHITENPEEAASQDVEDIENLDLDQNSSSNTLSEKISLTRKASELYISKDKFSDVDVCQPSTSKQGTSSPSDVDQESELLSKNKPFKLIWGSPDYDRDCDSKAVLTGSLLDFGTVLTSSDEEESPRKNNNLLLGNWTGTRKTLGKKFLKKFEKRGKPGHCPAVKSSDGVNANVFLTEAVDDDLDGVTSLPLSGEMGGTPDILTARPNSKQGTKSPLANLQNKVVSVIKEEPIERPKHPREHEEKDINENMSTKEAKIKLQDKAISPLKNDVSSQGNHQAVLPAMASKKRVVSKGLFDAADSHSLITDVESVSIVPFNPSKKTPTKVKGKPRKKKERSPMIKHDQMPGMCPPGSESSDEDNTNQPINRSAKKVRPGVRSGWLTNDNYRCESPGTAMRKMKEDGIIPKVRDLDNVMSDSKQRQLRELEELGIGNTRENGKGTSSTDSSGSGTNRSLHAKLTPITPYRPSTDSF